MMPEFINHHVSPTNDQQWRLPLALTIAVHLLVLILLVMPPFFLIPHHDFQKIQTINLFTADEIKPIKPKHHRVKHRAKVQPPAKKILPPPKAPAPPKGTQSINIKKQPQPLAKPEKVVSLRPHRLKKKPPKPIKTETADEERLRKALERAKARVNEKKEARKINQEISKLVKDLHTVPAPTPESSPPPAAANHGGTKPGAAQQASEAAGRSTASSTAKLDEATRRYYMAISRRIHSHWSLPETQNWEPSLEAVIVIVVHRNGTVSRTFFEKKSPNVYFNQYVEKTISASSPMPAFPSDIKRERLEIGLKFRPSGMF